MPTSLPEYIQKFQQTLWKCNNHCGSLANAHFPFNIHALLEAEWSQAQAGLRRGRQERNATLSPLPLYKGEVHKCVNELQGPVLRGVGRIYLLDKYAPLGIL